MNDHGNREAIERHYRQENLAARILEGLRAMGKNATAPTPEDLAPVDQFHTGGLRATRELAELAGLRKEATVLDVGGGLGGPARTLAHEFGCRVTVLDLTEEFCRAGELLTARTGLAERVRFRCGTAVEMPFADSSFDVVWTQHSTMNIEDKWRLYTEAYRVLRPGGRLAMHEIMAGPVQPIHFPVPWARDPAISHLRPPEEVRALLAASGFKAVTWVDASAESVTWFHGRVAALADSPGPLPVGLHLLLGADATTMVQNVLRNLGEGRIVMVKAVLEK